MGNFWYIPLIAGGLFTAGIIFLYFGSRKLYNFRKDNNNKGIVSLLAYIFFIWVFVCFSISVFCQNLLFEFLFGVLTIIIIFLNDSYFIITNEKKSFGGVVSFVIEFLIGIGITIYLIYLITDKTIQNITIPLVSAIYGGFITLVGVAWTIKKSDEDRKRDEMLKSKPYFIIEPLKICNFKEPEGCICKEDSKFFIKKHNIYAKIKNSNNSMFKLNRIYCDNEYNSFSTNNVVIPGCDLIFEFAIDSEKNIFLEVLDALENPYFYEIQILEYRHEEGFDYSVDDIPVYTIKSIREISKQEMDIKIKDSSKNSKS